MPQQERTVQYRDDSGELRRLTYRWDRDRDPTQQELQQLIAQSKAMRGQVEVPQPEPEATGPGAVGSFMGGFAGEAVPGVGMFLPRGTEISPETERITEQMREGLSRVPGAPGSPQRFAEQMLPILAQPSVENIQRARENFQQGDVAGGIGRSLGAVPLVGTETADIVDTFRDNPALAFGRSLGLLFGGAATRGGSRVLGETIQGIKGAESIPIPGRRRVGAMFQSIREFFSEVAGSSTFGNRYKAQFDDVVQKNANEVADQMFDRLLRDLPDDPVESGRMFRQAVQEFNERVRRPIGQQIEAALLEFDKAGAVASTRALKEAARSRLRSLGRFNKDGQFIFNPENRFGLTGSTLRAEVRELQATLQLPDEMPLRDLWKRTSELGQISRGGPALDKPSDQAIELLRANSREALMEAVEESMGRDVAEGFGEHLRRWRTSTEFLESSVVQKILTTDAPEKFGGILNEIGSDSIELLERELSDETMDLMRREAAEALWVKSTTVEPVGSELSKMLGGLSERLGMEMGGATIEGVNGRRLLENLIGSTAGGERQGRALARRRFGRQVAENMEKLGLQITKAQTPGGLETISRIPGIFAAGLDTSVFGMLGTGAVTGSAPLLAGGLAAAGALRMFSKVAFNTKATNFVSKALDAVAEKNMRKAAFWFARADQTLIDAGEHEPREEMNLVERIRAGMEAARESTSPFGLPNPGGTIRDRELQEQ